MNKRICHPFLDNKDYYCLGYVITDANWPCGTIYDISGNDFKGDFEKKNIIYSRETPKNYKYCQDEDRLEQWLYDHYEDLTWRIYPDGDFYVSGVYKEVK